MIGPIECRAPGLIRRHLGSIRDADPQNDRLSLAEQANVHFFVDRRQAHEVDQVHVVLDPRAIEFQNDIAHENPAPARPANSA